MLPIIDIQGLPVALDEWQGKQLLAGYGIAHPGGCLVASATEAVCVADTMGYPVVVKAVGAALAHKSEMGAVALNLRDAAAIDIATSRMAELGDAVLVEPMVTDTVAELLVGVVRDPQVGLCLVLGAGGVLVELLADRALLLLPTTEGDLREALLGLKSAPLLQGFRGRPAGDVDAAVAAALAVARFAVAHADRLVELDINPLIVRPGGPGRRGGRCSDPSAARGVRPMSEVVRVARDGAILEVVLDRPKANAIDSAHQPARWARCSPPSATMPSCGWLSSPAAARSSSAPAGT